MAKFEVVKDKKALSKIDFEIERAKKTFEGIIQKKLTKKSHIKAEHILTLTEKEAEVLEEFLGLTNETIVTDFGLTVNDDKILTEIYNAF